MDDSIAKVHKIKKGSDLLKYLQKERPHVLAVDLGCGTGQITCQLAPHFQEVVGFDISEAQLEQARAVAGCPNVTYRWGPVAITDNPKSVLFTMSVREGWLPITMEVGAGTELVLVQWSDIRMATEVDIKCRNNIGRTKCFDD